MSKAADYFRRVVLRVAFRAGRRVLAFLRVAFFFDAFFVAFFLLDFFFAAMVFLSIRCSSGTRVRSPLRNAHDGILALAQV